MHRRWWRPLAVGLTTAAVAAGCGGSDEDVDFGSGSGGSTSSGSGSGTSSGSGSGSGGSSGSGSGSGSSSGSGGGPVSSAIVDLRADVNRNGAIDLSDPTEDQNEDTWDATHGAIFLANIDDDAVACPKTGQTDAQYAACNDAADSVINGPADLDDLARLAIAPWPKASADATGTISVSAPDRVRLFRKNAAGDFESFAPQATTFAAADLASGVDLAIEAKDIARDASVWDGFVDVSLSVTGTDPDSGLPMPETKDTVRLRVAPVLFRHHLDPARTVYVSKINSSASTALRTDLATAATAASLPEPVFEYANSDQWTQDFFETAYTSMPGPGGKAHVVHVNFRSANFTNNLRSAGRIIFALRGQDVAAAVQYDPQHDNNMDTLNSFGNLETIPPYAFDGKNYTQGRVLRGSTPSFFPDTSFDRMITAQAAQPIVYIPTEWLLVGHVDETTTFVKTSSPRGWALGLNDPALAKKMLEDAKAAGHGGTPMFVGKSWWGNQSAEVTIDQVLADPDVMSESASAAVEIAAQLDVLKQETGITDEEIIHIPFLHQPSQGFSVAYQPGTVNGIFLSNTDFGVPRPHGPVIDGQDIFEAQLVQTFAPYGITVHFIEDWDLYHRLDGEVHCGTNTTRVVPETNPWWEAMP